MLQVRPSYEAGISKLKIDEMPAPAEPLNELPYDCIGCIEETGLM